MSPLWDCEMSSEFGMAAFDPHAGAGRAGNGGSGRKDARVGEHEMYERIRQALVWLERNLSMASL